jgi:citrate lyase subunit beta/citryl-CoA lyase
VSAGLAPGLASARSLLFAPGDDAQKIAKAFASGADGAIADLEDAVTQAGKATARRVTRQVLAQAEGDCLRLVRVNGPASGLGDDLAAIEGLELDALVLPKATMDSVEAVGESGTAVIAIVETAAGLRSVYELAEASLVVALALGGLDLRLELGLERRTDGQEILFARSQLVAASAAAGLRPPFDTVFEGLADDEGLKRECSLARSLGFWGKLCVHPRQVAAVNAAFAPSEAELAQARRMIEAYECAVAEGRGAVAIDGMLVDSPVVERARRLLRAAESRMRAR